MSSTLSGLVLQKNSNKFKWADESDLSFTNWAEVSLSNKTGNNCVKMVPEGTSIGKRVDEPCNKKNLVVCRKMQNWSISHLQNTLLHQRNILKGSEFINKKFQELKA
jgi:hypothetical protein